MKFIAYGIGLIMLSQRQSQDTRPFVCGGIEIKKRHWATFLVNELIIWNPNGTSCDRDDSNFLL